MKQLIFLILVIVCSTFAMNIIKSDNIPILENLFWNSEEDDNEHLDLSEYGLNGALAHEQHTDENVTLFEKEAFSGAVSVFLTE